MSHAYKVLEFDAVRLALARQSETGLGASLALKLEPAFEAGEVWSRLEFTEEAHSLLGLEKVPPIAAVRDLRDAFHRASKGSVLGGTELFQIAECLGAMRQLRAFLQARKDDYPKLWKIADALPEHARLEEALLKSLEPDGSVKDSASTELHRLRRSKATVQNRILERIKSYVNGKARELLSEALYTIRDGRYVIPLKAEYKGRIKGIVHDTSASGQTVYIEPEDVLQLGNQLREAEAAEREEIERILGELSEKVGAISEEAVFGIEQTGHLDFLFAKARLAFEWHGTKPQESKGHGISLTKARHPLLDSTTVVPLSIEIGWQTPGLLITGPNTGGKTVAIKCVGLCVLMAQSGLYPPADSIKLGPFTQVWADIGDEQSIQQSLSTFSGHVKNIGEALNGLKTGALVLLDEIGAGTDPAEGGALAKAILNTLKEKGATILASTHYGELKAFAYNTEGFQNAAMEFDEKTLRPTFHLIMGAPGASHALRVAERFGIPKDVVERGRQGLSPEQLEVSQLMEKLEHAEKQSRAAQSEADQRVIELRALQDEAERKLDEAAEVRRTAHARATAIVEDALREIRLEAERLFEEIKKAAGDPAALQTVREDLKALQESGREIAESFQETPEAQEISAPLIKGQSVRVLGFPQIGTLLEMPKGGQVPVQMGALRLTVSVDKLIAVKSEPPASGSPFSQKQKRGPAASGIERAMNAKQELHLRALRAEEAEHELERFLDDAVLAGLDRVRIVHGKGGGTLRKVTQSHLKKSPHVKSFRDGEPAEGGAGVTIAVLK